MTKNSKRITIAKELKDLLVDSAKSEGLTQTELISRAIKSYLKYNIDIKLKDRGKGGSSTNLYLTHTEQDILKQLAAKESISSSKFVANMIRKEVNLAPINDKELIFAINRLVTQVRAIGINLNQQSRAIKNSIKYEKDYAHNTFFKNLENTQKILAETVISISKLQKSFKRL